MAYYPATRFDLAPGYTARTDDVTIINEWYLLEDDIWDDFGTFMSFLSKEELITYESVIKVIPSFDGKLTITNVETLLDSYPKLNTGIGFIIDGKVELINKTNRTIYKWALFTHDGMEFCPVQCSFKSMVFSKNEIFVPIIETILTYEDKNDGVTLSSPATRDKMFVETKERLGTAITYKWVRDWFNDTIVMNVPGDGKCGAHALHEALADINVYIDFEQICEALETLSQGETSWWDIGCLRTYCEMVGVKLLVKQLDGDKLNYWWTTNDVLPIIGIWGNGTHYQWCKKIKRVQQLSATNVNDASSNETLTVSSSVKKVKSVTFSENSVDRSIAGNERKHSVYSISSDYETELGLKIEGKTVFDSSAGPIVVDKHNTVSSEKASKYNINVNKPLYGPAHLQEFFLNEDAEDAEMLYEMPEIETNLRENDYHNWLPFERINPLIPKRMDGPLITLPIEIANSIANNDYQELKFVHQHWRSPVAGLAAMLSDPNYIVQGKKKTVTNNITALKTIIRMDFGMDTKLISKTVASCAKQFTENDFFIATQEDINVTPFITNVPDVESYHVVISTLRHLIVQTTMGSRFEGNDYVFELLYDGRYVLRGTNESKPYIIIGVGSLFYIEHSDFELAFIGTMTYFDYTITYTEVRHTMRLIMAQSEYSWFIPIGELLLELSESTAVHNDIVNLMKAYEGLALHVSDMIDTEYLNWNPALDAINEFTECCNTVMNESACTNDFFSVIYEDQPERIHDTLALRFFHALKKMNGQQLQESSSCHKFLYYAESDPAAGVHKFLSRVHTPRSVDPIFIHKMTCFARRLFVLSYIKRHNEAPSFLHSNEETETIEFCVKNKLLNQLEKEAVTWWSNVIPYNCLTVTTAKNVLEVAKDKGALKKEVRFAPGDSHRELLQVIETPIISYGEMKLDEIPSTNEISIKIQRSERHSQKLKYPTRLIPKEKEQKTAARLFGNANLENKHGLSYKMLKAKKALSYFNSEVMTKGDRERKLKLHNMAQSLKDSNTYCLMLDIEGHNQSMQKNNTAALYEFVGLLYGEHDWAKLADYFSAQTVYFYDEFYDWAIVSEGQLGGIEGWYNPLWTLHSTIVTELLPFETTIDLREAAIYSDDVAITTVIEKPDSNLLNMQFSQMTRHYGRAGLTVKMKQTAMSRNRVTLLRSHFCKGWKSDSSIKRLLATSTMNNSNFVSEEIEIAGLSSTLSSALELSEHIMPIVYIKWYYITLCSIRLFAAYLEKPRNTILWDLESAPSDIKHLLYYEKGDRFLTGRKTAMELALDFARAASDQSIILEKNMNEDQIMTLIKKIYGVNAATFQTLQVKDLVYLMLLNDKYMKSLFFLTLTLPCAVGGKGAGLLVNDVLSGHSDGFHKQVHYLHQWLHCGQGQGQWIIDAMAHALRVPEQELSSHPPTELCTSNWPSVSYPKPVDSLISSKLRSIVKKRCVNREIKKLLMMDEKRKEFHTSLVNAASPDLQPRILQFYAENSCFHLLDVLIKKVETSSGFCNLIPNLKAFRKAVSFNEILNIEKMYRSDVGWFPKLNRHANVLDELVSRRNMMLHYPIKVNVEEPLYDHLLTRNGPSRGTLVVLPSSVKTYENGLHVMKPPIFGNEALYKGDLTSDDSHFQGLEEVLCAKLGSVTRWLLIKSNIRPTSYFLENKPLYVVLCDISLSTLVQYTFEDLLPLIPINAKGEIFHRIPNMRYKTKSVIRSLPNSINMYSVSINQEEINNRNLTDSNIHFDYITQRLKVKHTLAHKYANIEPIIQRYHIENDPYIYDVSDWTCERISEIPAPTWLPYAVSLNKDVDFGRIKYIAASYLTSENYNVFTEKHRTPLANDLELAGDNIITSLLGQYYRELRRNKMILGLETTPADIWLPLLRQLQTKYNVLLDNDLKDPKAIVREYIRRARHNFAGVVKKYNVNQVFDEVKHHLQVTFENEKDLITEYVKVIENMQRKRKDETKEKEKIKAATESWEMTYNILGPRKNASTALVTTTLIENCLVITIDKGLIKIDRDRTFQLFNLYLQKYMLVLPNSVVATELFEILYRNYDDDIKAILFNNACNTIDEGLLKFKPVDLDMPKVVMKPVVANTLSIDQKISSTAEQVRFLFERTGMEIFNDDYELRKMINLIKHAANLYSHPAIFQSPTGSDSYAAQFGLFTKLKETALISPESLVYDLTAGRGDGHIALTRLNINHVSFNRLDTFTSSYAIEGIVSRDNYDIALPETLDFILSSDFVHIDVSWTDQGQLDFVSTLLFLVKHKKKFSVRLNSIKFGRLPKDFEALVSKYRFLITIPSVANLCPYQIYFIGYPTKSESKMPIIPCHETHYYRALQKRYSSLIDIKNLLFAPNIGMTNSVRILVDHTHSPGELCTALMNNEEHDVVKSKLGALMDILMDPEMLAMPASYLEQLTIDPRVNFEAISDNYDPKVYGYDDTMQVGGQSKIKQKQWRNLTKDILNNTVVKYKPAMNLGTEDLLNRLKYDIPQPRVRGKVAAAAEIMNRYGIQFPVNIDAIAKLRNDLNLAQDNFLNTTLPQVRNAILLIYYSAGINNYQFGVLFLWTQLKISRKQALQTYKTLETYRKLSGLYHKFRQSFLAGTEDVNVFTRIRRDVIDVGLRNNDIKQYYVKRKEESKKKYEAIKTADIEKVRENLFGKEAQKNMIEMFEGLIRSPVEGLTTTMGDNLDNTVDNLLHQSSLDSTTVANIGDLLAGFTPDSIGLDLNAKILALEDDFFDDEPWAECDLE